MSPIQCLDMIATSTFRTPEGRPRKVELNTENKFAIEELGTINIGDNSVTCHGQSKKIWGYVINDVLQIAQYKVLIKEEKFLVNNGRIETISHLRLLKSCNININGCRLNSITYVWNSPWKKCSLEKIRDVNLYQENGFLINQDLNILLKKGNRQPTPSGCPKAKLFATEYDNIYLALKTAGDWSTMTSDLDFNDYVKARDNYVMYELKQRIARKDK